MVPNSFTQPAGWLDGAGAAAAWAQSDAGDIAAIIGAIKKGATRRERATAIIRLSSFTCESIETYSDQPAKVRNLCKLRYIAGSSTIFLEMNVVFDLGGVVVAWRPSEIVARAFVDPDTRLLVERQIIGHPDWLELDRGALTVDAVVRRGAARTGLSEIDIREFIEGVPAALVADTSVVALVRRLHAVGHRLFCLSNMPELSMEHLERAYDFWEVFSGAVISSRVGHCKPEPAIYEHLIATYQLDPADTVFIDDVPANVAAAATFGIRTIRFENVEQCEAALRQLGCL